MLWLQRRPLPAIHDGIGSMTAGLLMSMWKLLFARALEVGSYAWVHERWCVADLPWDSPWMWWAAFFGVDLGYYLFHRMAHGKFAPPLPPPPLMHAHRLDVYSP